MREWANEEWIRALRSGGAEQREALNELRAGILRALRWYLGERGGDRPPDRAHAASLAEDFAQDAVLVVLDKLPTFRGESRFTTWAHKVALHHALGKLRRRRFKEISLEGFAIGDGMPERWIEDRRAGDPERAARRAEIWSAVHGIIRDELSPRQRTVLVGHVFQEVPLDVLADHLACDRDAVYKVLHDARRKIKRRLEDRGLTPGSVLKTFEGV